MPQVVYMLFVYTVIYSLFICDVSKAKDDKKYLRDNRARQSFTRCLGRRGVCIPSKVCPWDKILQDEEQCMEKHHDLLCCRVSPIAMFGDLFLVIL